MRRLALCLVILLGVACAAETVTPLTTTTVPVEEPSTTTTAVAAESTTTTGPEGPVDLCTGETLLWEVGVEYRAGCFVTPVGFTVDEDRWRSRGGSENWVWVSWVHPTNLDEIVNVAITVSGDRSGVSARLEEIVSKASIIVRDDPVDVAVAGRSGVAFDIEGAQKSDVGEFGRRVCSAARYGGVYFNGDSLESYAVAPAREGDYFGVGACQVARVWVLSVGEEVVTIIGGTADPDRHTEAVAKIEELFEGVSFDARAGS